MDNYLKYSVRNGELNLYVTEKEFELFGGNKAGKFNFQIIKKEITEDQKIKKGILELCDELKRIRKKIKKLIIL
jgi:hypothetical protein